MRITKFQFGFIDPISLITLGFLLVGLVVTTSIVKNPDISLDVHSFAKMIGDFGKVTPVKKTAPEIVPPPANSTVTTHGTVNTTPAVTTTNTVNSTIAPTSATPPPTTTQPTVTQPAAQPSEESRFVARQQAETQSPSPTVAPTINCSSFGSCYRETYTCEKEFGQLGCGDGFKCGVHCLAPAAAVAKTTAPTTTTQPAEESRFTARQEAENEQKCLAEGNTLTECQAGKPLTTPLKTTAKKTEGQLCDSDSECQSGQCFASAAYYQGTADSSGLSAVALAGSIKRCHTATPQDYQTIQAAENQGNLAATALAAAALGGAVAVPAILSTAGTTVTATGLTGALLTATNIPNAIYSNITAALASAPAWLQTAGAAAILAQGPLAIYTCEKYGADSPQCQYAAMGITASYYSDVIGSEQALQNAVQPADDLITQLLTRKKSVSEGQSFERVVTKYQTFGSQTLERSG